MSSGTIRIWFLIHKWTSLVCTAFLLMLCLTGLPLIFHEEIDNLLEGPPPLANVPPGSPVKTLDDVLANAIAVRPDEVPIYMSFDEDLPVVYVTTGPTTDAKPAQMHFLALDRRTAEVIQEPKDEGIMHVIFQLHVDMFMGLPGELFLGFMGFLFFIAIVSGIVVYVPFMRKLPFGTVRLSRSRRAKWLDIHNLFGAVTLIWASVVGLTGVVNTLATPLVQLWRANELAALVAPYEGKPLAAERASIARAVETAMAAAPDMVPQFIAFPGAPYSSSHHYAVWLHGATPATEDLLKPALIDAETGKLTAVRSMPWYMTVLMLSRPLHFGDYGGLPLKIIWALLDTAAIVILGSGLYLWLARRGAPIPRAAAPGEGRVRPLPDMEPAE